MKRSHPAFSFIVVAALVLGACSSGDSSNGDPTVPIPTAATSLTSTTSADSTTTSTGSASSDASTSTTSSSTRTNGPPTTLIRPADLVTDPNDPNNLHTSLPEHQPIIDAYVAAINAELITYSQWPLDPTSTELMGAPISDEMRSRENSGLVERTQLNQVLDISGGMTLRPYVVENDDPTRAFVWDCQIDATFWKDKDTGAKAPPDAWPNNGPPGVEVGISAVMVLVEGEWLLDDGGLEPRACE